MFPKIISVREAYLSQRIRKEKLLNDSFIKRERRPIESWSGIDLLLDVGCHASSLAASKTEDLTRVSSDPRKFMMNPQHGEARVRSVLNNADFGAFHSALQGAIDLADGCAT